MSPSRLGHTDFCRKVQRACSSDNEKNKGAPSPRDSAGKLILCNDGLAQDVPQGFVCVHLERRKCYAVRGTQGDAATINLRCALHYLRNYGMECAGVLFSPSRDGAKQTIALLEAGRSPLRDNPRHRWRNIICLLCVLSREPSRFTCLRPGGSIRSPNGF